MSTPFMNLFGGLFSTKSVGSPSAKSRRRPGQPRPRTHRMLGCEGLERREMMTASSGFAPVAAPTVTHYNSPIIAAPAAEANGNAYYTAFSAKPVSTSEIELTWSGGDSAGYNYVCELINNEWMEIGYTNDPSNSFLVTGLQAGTKYEFKLGDNALWTSNQTELAYGNAQSATTISDPMPAPKLTGSAPTSSTADLSWNAVSGATGYEVQQYNTSNNTWVTIATTTSTSYAAPHLSAASTNYFRVAGVESNELGAFSNTVSVLTRPASPTNVAATAVSTSQLDVSWGTVAGAQGYYISYKTPQSGWMYAYAPAGQTSLQLPNLSAGVTYTIEVGASNASGASYSNPVSAATKAQVSLPTAPTNFVVTPLTSTNTEFQLSWSPVAGATSYTVYVYYEGRWTPYESTKNSYVDLGQTAGYTYSYFVAAVNSAGTGPGSGYHTVTAT